MCGCELVGEGVCSHSFLAVQMLDAITNGIMMIGQSQALYPAHIYAIPSPMGTEMFMTPAPTSRESR
jgi:hypothetical protein